MGRPMAERLLSAGFTLAAYDVEVSRATALGARVAGSAAECARNCDIVMLCVPDGKAVEAAVFGRAGVADAANAAMLLVDCSTIGPDLTRSLAARLEGTSGMRWVDAPISGGVAGASAGSLAAMCGGAAEDVERARPALDAFCARVSHMGPVGAGQATKMCNQVIVGCTLAVIAEAIHLAERNGISGRRLLEALSGGAAESWALRSFGARMAARDFSPPRGAIGGMLKDLNLAATFAATTQAEHPMTEAAIAAIRRYVIKAGKEADTASLIRLYE